MPPVTEKPGPSGPTPESRSDAPENGPGVLGGRNLLRGHPSADDIITVARSALLVKMPDPMGSHKRRHGSWADPGGTLCCGDQQRDYVARRGEMPGSRGPTDEVGGMAAL